MKFARKLLTILVVLAFATSWASVASSADSSGKAKEILEKTSNKYSELIKKDGKDLKSIEAKITIKGGGQVPMGDSAMPLTLDLVLEIYAERPNNFFLALSGNLGNAAVVVAGKGDKSTATIMLPTTKQFAVMDVPEKFDPAVPKDKPEEPAIKDEFWEDVILEYVGEEKTKSGKAHKINIKPKDQTESSFVTVYILDKKWDPALIEVHGEGDSKIVVEFETLKLNAKISDKRFVPETQGYTQVTDKQITSLIMMQIMTAMMQAEQGGE